jgi:hypothetical protein
MRCTFFVWPFFLPKLNLGVHKYTLAPCPVFGGNFKTQVITPADYDVFLTDPKVKHLMKS